MPSYYRLVFSLLFLATTLFASIPQKDTNKEGLLILMALDYELHNDLQSSSLLYKKLFELTKKGEYLDYAITQSFTLKDYKTTRKLCKANLDKYPKEDQRYYRLAISSSLQLEKIDEALALSKRLIKKYNNSINYTIISSIYYFNGEFEKAISYLETNIKQNGCSKIICNQLLTYYQEQQNIDGIIKIARKAYWSYKNKADKKKVQKLLIMALEKKDIKLAIKYLENTKVDDIKLLSLYGRTNQYEDALYLLKKEYKKTRNKSILGKIAIIRFEMAKDKMSVMKHVEANFEIAIKATNNANYKNYYGYILINRNINIKKGLKLVQEALLSSPNNLAYADSVAWGYYKLNNCKKAKKYMQIIVNQVGLDNPEIKLHWEKIQECGK